MRGFVSFVSGTTIAAAMLAACSHDYSTSDAPAPVDASAAPEAAGPLVASEGGEDATSDAALDAGSDADADASSCAPKTQACLDTFTAQIQNACNPQRQGCISACHGVGAACLAQCTSQWSTCIGGYEDACTSCEMQANDCSPRDDCHAKNPSH